MISIEDNPEFESNKGLKIEDILSVEESGMNNNNFGSLWIPGS